MEYNHVKIVTIVAFFFCFLSRNLHPELICSWIHFILFSKQQQQTTYYLRNSKNSACSIRILIR